MNNIINIENFTGQYAFSVGQFQDNFNDFIAKLQKKYLKCFLGVEAYRELESYYDDSEAEAIAKWDNFLNGTDYTSDTTGYLAEFEGFKQILIKIVYAEWIISDDYFNETGGFRSQNENSNKLSRRKMMQKSNSVYNEAVFESQILYDFMMTNENTDYPDFTTFFTAMQLRGNNVFTLY